MKNHADKFKDALLIKAPLRFLKRNVVRDLGNQSLPHRALLYFKTDPLFSRRLVQSFEHTNNSEILMMLETLNRFGFRVDLVDRDASWEEIVPLMNNRYRLYIGNAAGASAPQHVAMLSCIDAQTKVFFGAGPEPEESNRLVEARHREFDERTGRRSVRRRLVHENDLAQRFEGIDAIFFVGNEFGQSTYARHRLPTFRIDPSSSPHLSIEAANLRPRDPRRFLYFGGNGLICKGLDLVLEAFDGEKSLELDVCGPPTETDFWEHYRPLLDRNPQIRYHGFISIKDATFRRVTSECAFNIFPGSAEGCATSVTTCMRKGVIPVTTWETGVDLGDFGLSIPTHSVSAIRELVRSLAGMSQAEVNRRVRGTYAESFRYTDCGFRKSFELALMTTLEAPVTNP